jgi:5-methylcytosine-specific restriction endonuclease McrA
MSQYIRRGIYPLDAVLPYVVFKRLPRDPGTKDRQRSSDREYDGWIVDMSSQRYQLFASKGTRCVVCGLEGRFFALEQDVYAHVHEVMRNPKRCHFNLYGIDATGTEVMLTKDHIVPASAGGPDALDNYQPMCETCNQAKGAQCQPKKLG